MYLRPEGPAAHQPRRSQFRVEADRGRNEFPRYATHTHTHIFPLIFIFFREKKRLLGRRAVRDGIDPVPPLPPAGSLTTDNRYLRLLRPKSTSIPRYKINGSTQRSPFSRAVSDSRFIAIYLSALKLVFSFIGIHSIFIAFYISLLLDMFEIQC